MLRRFRTLVCGKKGAYEKLTTELFSALCLCLVTMSRAELIICGLFHLSPFFNHRFHA